MEMSIKSVGMMIMLLAAMSGCGSSGSADIPDLRPDLYFPIAPSASPTPAEVGETITITATIKNKGDLSASSVSVELRDSGGAVLSTLDAGTFLSGESKIAQFTLVPDADGIGVHELDVVIVTIEEEVSTANNTATVTVTVVAST